MNFPLDDRFQIRHTDPTLGAHRPGQILIGDKNYFGAEFEATLADAGLTLLRPARTGEPQRAGSRFFKPLHQTVESIFDTYKATSTSNTMAASPPPASWSASYNASSP